MLQKAARPLGETQQRREAMQEANFLLPPAFPSQPWEPSHMSARREKHDKDNHDNDDTGLQQQRSRQRNVIQKLFGPLSFVQLLQPRQRAVEGQPRQRRHWIATTAQTTKKRNSETSRTECLVCHVPSWSNDDKEPSKDNHDDDVTGLQQQRRRQRNVIQRRT